MARSVIFILAVCSALCTPCARSDSAQSTSPSSSSPPSAPSGAAPAAPVPVTQAPATTPAAAKPAAKPAAAKPVASKSAAAKTTSPKPAAAAVPVHYHPNRFSKRAELHYTMVWGVDSLSVRWAESGEVIRFSYRVLDSDKAKALNDKRSEPSLIDVKAGVSLVVPALEQVGKLRQSEDPEDGKSYWMAFSNKGRLVKRGDHVDVVIGQFRADGLVVD